MLAVTLGRSLNLSDGIGVSAQFLQTACTRWLFLESNEVFVVGGLSIWRMVEEMSGRYYGKSGRGESA